jgi:isochorismate synthase
MAAPLVPAERLLAFPGLEDQQLWAPSPEDEQSGVGAAHILTGTGPARFVQVRRAAAQLFQSLTRLDPEGLAAPSPRLIGGFAFQEARIASTQWRAFGDARFVLPRIAYRRRAQRAWLSLTAPASELSNAAGRARLAQDAHLALQILHRELPAPHSEPDAPLHVGQGEDEWVALVEGICGEIAAGRLAKVVAARRIVLRGERLPTPARILAQLRLEAPHCTRYALSVAGRTFLGASPERLVRRIGLRVWTEALAGSMPGNEFADGDALMRSLKERHEHDIVVRQIRSVLEPLNHSLGANGPELRRLRHGAHLRTRFQGVLKQPTHVLELASRLHPTPAVGGSPGAAALAWLAQHEHVDRGFYAGPFGVFDSAGDGEFIVAIRSGLRSAREAHLYAGSGIVGGSEVTSELRETRWKLRGLLAAFGVP